MLGYICLLYIGVQIGAPWWVLFARYSGGSRETL